MGEELLKGLSKSGWEVNAIVHCDGPLAQLLCRRNNKTVARNGTVSHRSLSRGLRSTRLQTGRFGMLSLPAAFVHHPQVFLVLGHSIPDSLYQALQHLHICVSTSFQALHIYHSGYLSLSYHRKAHSTGTI